MIIPLPYSEEHVLSGMVRRLQLIKVFAYFLSSLIILWTGSLQFDVNAFLKAPFLAEYCLTIVQWGFVWNIHWWWGLEGGSSQALQCIGLSAICSEGCNYHQLSDSSRTYWQHFPIQTEVFWKTLNCKDERWFNCSLSIFLHIKNILGFWVWVLNINWNVSRIFKF